METRDKSQEVFRRTWLVLIPDVFLALGVLVGIILLHRRLGLRGGWGGVGVIAVIHILWMIHRITQWSTCTWVAISDGRLIIRDGLLSSGQQVLHFCSARHLELDSPFPFHLLSVGHVAFRATDPNGQLRSFHWKWMGEYRRLGEIIEAQGQLSIGRPSRWQLVRRKAVQEWEALKKTSACWRRRRNVDDYGRFMAFCHHLLRGTTPTLPTLHGVPASVSRRWMAVLRQARVVVDAPGGKGWQLAGTVRSLEDIRRRIGESQLRRAVQRR
jgi:hypothetical protein